MPLIAEGRKPLYEREPQMIPRPDLPPKLSAEVKRVNTIVPSELLERVDNYRRGLPGLPNRSFAIRKLIELGLEAVERKPSPKAKPKGKGPSA